MRGSRLGPIASRPRALALAFPILAAGGCACGLGAQGAAPASGPMTYHLHQIFVPAEVNGEPVGLALIDTGANSCAMDTALAERLAIEPQGETEVLGSAGSSRAGTIRLASLSVWGAEARDVVTTIYDLGHGATPTGEPLALIIGEPFLRHFGVEIDYRSERLVLHAEPVEGPRSIPMEMDDGIPLLRGRLDGVVDLGLRIDTGASLFETQEAYVNIPEHARRSLEARGIVHAEEFALSGSGVGGTVRLPVIRLDRLELGGVEIERPLAIVQPRAGVFARDDAPGFVGSYTLAPLGRIVIDYLDGTLDVLEPVGGTRGRELP